MSGMGGGWFDAMGGGWFDAMGGGWVDSAGGGGGGHGFAMRADRPLAEHRLKKINIGVAFPAFPSQYWDSDLTALAYLPKFFSFVDPAGKTWDQALDVAKPPQVVQSGLPPDDSIDELLTMAVTERPEAMGEILNQNQNQQLCFLQLLMIKNTSHPKTYFAMKLMARVGEVVMMHFKRKFNRARPSQVCPTLYPPVPVPGHAAYPAGHAVIANLTAACLKEITIGPDAAPSPSTFEEALDLLAETIGRNRVIAGLHY
jgi:acid phosphatase (class A)